MLAAVRLTCDMVSTRAVPRLREGILKSTPGATALCAVYILPGNCLKSWSLYFTKDTDGDVVAQGITGK